MSPLEKRGIGSFASPRRSAGSQRSPVSCLAKPESSMAWTLPLALSLSTYLPWAFQPPGVRPFANRTFTMHLRWKGELAFAAGNSEERDLVDAPLLDRLTRRARRNRFKAVPVIGRAGRTGSTGSARSKSPSSFLLVSRYVWHFLALIAGRVSVKRLFLDPELRLRCKRQSLGGAGTPGPLSDSLARRPALLGCERNRSWKMALREEP